VKGRGTKGINKEFAEKRKTRKRETEEGRRNNKDINSERNRERQKGGDE
jgi:hypothetical protein